MEKPKRNNRQVKSIQRYEYGRLIVGEEGFEQKHWQSLLKLNQLHEGKYFDVLHNGIRFNQYVGVLQVDNITIEIHPKADKDDEDGRWKGVLIKMLKACGKLKVETTGAANVKRQNLNLLEVYFELYLKELQILIHKGLVKKYRKDTKNVKALKGKLEFAGNIRHNLVHKERFYTTHQVYDTNHLLHQVLFEALQIVENFTKGTSLYDKCKRTFLDFPEVKKLNVNAQLLSNIKLNRKTQDYSYALEIARLIILNYSPDITSGNEKMLSLLFDMNKLWEEYILIQLRKEFENTNYEVMGQDTRPFLGSNYLQPDIVIQNTTDKNDTYIIDTKWKRPTSNSASVGDLRQMYAYNRFWNAEKAMLLYPGNFRQNDFKEFRTDDYFKQEGEINKINHQCKMGYVSVLDKENNLSQEVGKQVLELLEEQSLFYI
ncbi:MAG: restriction endonuclease [Flavobacteriales bacterium]|nr:restriction endonuclease [Flavobacteriales bacterium]